MGYLDTSQPRLRRITILSVLGPCHALMWVTHHRNALVRIRLTSEFESLKDLVLYRGGHVHIRHITLSPMVNVEYYISRMDKNILTPN
ncbi:hypothetical protein DVH24_016603 [Malus domestica]|uniref:Uncharacterized protein n=1 Tax=Malus domestica TaxID=3750 RepID=A0A498HX73_MALDO|nr:hypothetical protein DVH24_016603 [Malus domestica]